MTNADLIVDAGTVHTMAAGAPPVTTLAITGGTIAGMTTRATPAGALGPQHAISREEALRLYTVAGARVLASE